MCWFILLNSYNNYMGICSYFHFTEEENETWRDYCYAQGHKTWVCVQMVLTIESELSTTTFTFFSIYYNCIKMGLEYLCIIYIVFVPVMICI